MSAEQQSTLISMLQQLVDAKPARRRERPKRFNPRPPGVIQEGIASEAVLAFLTESPGLKTEAQIVSATKRTHSAVSWALIRLRTWEKIEAVADRGRHSRYFRYCIAKKAK